MKGIACYAVFLLFPVFLVFGHTLSIFGLHYTLQSYEKQIFGKGNYCSSTKT